MWQFIYNTLAIPGGWLVFQILRLFDQKVRRGVRGREHLFEDLEAATARLRPGSRRIWFHSSSMGEFEQAKPIIAELKKWDPTAEIIVSFFSPSGFEHSRSYKLADVITYLPFDSRRNAEHFIRLVKPSAAVMVRYDLWPNHLWELRKSGIPTFIANATLRPRSARALPLVRQFHQRVYDSLDFILTVSDADKKAFDAFGLRHPAVEVIGDTRYDQVWMRSADSRSHHFLPAAVIGGKTVLVVGSSWEEDENHLFPAVREVIARHPNFLVVLVPHEPTMETLERIEYRLNGRIPSIRFSTLGDYDDEHVVIIDSVGILMALYQYAHIAYVGGSFRQGVHNVLEPAAYGIPLIIGPKHANSQEAEMLVAEGAAFVGKDERELYELIRGLLDDEGRRVTAGGKALDFVRKNTGATGRFLSYLEKVL